MHLSPATRRGPLPGTRFSPFTTSMSKLFDIYLSFIYVVYIDKIIYVYIRDKKSIRFFINPGRNPISLFHSDMRKIMSV